MKLKGSITLITLFITALIGGGLVLWGAKTERKPSNQEPILGAFGDPFIEVQGGTGTSTYVIGDILYADGDDTLGSLPIGSANQVLTVSGGLPIWSAASGGGGAAWEAFSGIANVITPTNTNAGIFVRASSTIDSDLRVAQHTALGGTFQNTYGLSIATSTINTGNTIRYQNGTDSTTGWQILDADGGTPILNIDTTNENVGIGEVAPGSKLSVSGGATIGASYDTTAAPSNGMIIEGNVGIGTTGPGYKLDVAGDVGINSYTAMTAHADGTGYQTIDFKSIPDNTTAGFSVSPKGNVSGKVMGSYIWMYSTDYLSDLNNFGGLNIQIGTVAQGGIKFISSGAGTVAATQFSFTGGNVGIGTTDPSAMLHASSTSATTIAGILQGTQSQTANLLEFRNFGSTFLSGFTASGGLLMNISSTTALTVQNGSGTEVFKVDSTNAGIKVTGAATSTLYAWIGSAGTANSIDYTGGDLYVQDDVEIDDALTVVRASTTNFAITGYGTCTSLETNAQGTVLCGTDDTSAGGGEPGAWNTFSANVLRPTNTAAAILVNAASSTITGLVVSDSLTVPNDSIALTTKTTGNYAAGDAEAGAALTGDSATSFFSLGQIENARGGTGQDSSGWSGIAVVNSGTWSASSTLAVNRGGIGVGTIGAGELVVGNGTSPITSTSTLSVVKGGTGATTLTDGGILFGGGTSLITASAVLTNGQLLIGDGSGVPTAATLTGTADEITITNGAGSITIDIPDPLIVSKGGTGAATLASTEILVGAGTSAITSTSTVSVVRGGTGQTTLAAGSIFYGNGTSPMTALAIGTTRQVLQVNTGATAPEWTSNILITQATTTNFAVTGMTAANCDVKATTDGVFYCGTDSTSAGGGEAGAWETFVTNVLRPTNTVSAILINAATSTITNLVMNNATSTGNFVVGTSVWQAPTSSLSILGGFHAFNSVATSSNAFWAGSAGVATNIDLQGGDIYVQGDLEVDGTMYGSVSCTDCIALGTETTNNYVATVADDGTSTITVVGSGSETAAITLKVIDVSCTDCLGTTEIADSYLLNDGDTGTGTYIFSGDARIATLNSTSTLIDNLSVKRATTTDSLAIPNGTACDVSSTGRFCLDTTFNQMIMATSTDPGASPGVIPLVPRLFGITVASSTALVSGNTFDIGVDSAGFTVVRMQCFVKNGTSVVANLTDGTNDTNTKTCTTTSGGDWATTTSNNVWVGGEPISLELGTNTSNVESVTVSIFGFYTRK